MAEEKRRRGRPALPKDAKLGTPLQLSIASADAEALRQFQVEHDLSSLAEAARVLLRYSLRKKGLLDRARGDRSVK